MRWQRFAVVTMVVVAGAGGAARAEESTDGAGRNVPLAERRAAEAFDAYSRGEYPNAVTLYLEAYAASPSAPILYNLARIYDTKLGDRAQASTFYRRYIASADARPDLTRTARARLDELDATGTRTVLRDSADASPDKHANPVAAPTPMALPAPRSPDPETSGSSARRWVGVALGATGLAGVAVGGAFGLAARSKANTAHQLCDGNVCNGQAGVDAARAGWRDATIANIAFGSGAALLLTGVILYVSGTGGTAEKAVASDLRFGAGAAGSALTFELEGRW